MALGILTKKCETLLTGSFGATDFSLLSNGFKELDGYGPAAAADRKEFSEFPLLRRYFVLHRNVLHPTIVLHPTPSNSIQLYSIQQHPSNILLYSMQQETFIPAMTR